MKSSKSRLRAFRIGICAALLVVLAACSTSATNSGSTPAGAASKAASSSTGKSAIHDMLPKSIQSAGEIKAATPLNTPPVIYLDSDGKTIKGFIYDLTQAMSEKLGVKFDIINMPFPGEIPALQAGRIDMMINMTDHTPERAKILSFVDFIIDGGGFLTQKGNPKNIHTIADLCGVSVAVVRSSSFVSSLEEQSKTCVANGKGKVDTHQYDDAANGRLQVATGRVDTWLGTNAVLGYQAEHEGSGKLEVVVGEPIRPIPAGMVVRQDQPELTKAIDAALNAVAKDGTYKELLRKYNLLNSGIPALMTLGS